jgi:hypothetical protein
MSNMTTPKPDPALTVKEIEKHLARLKEIQALPYAELQELEYDEWSWPIEGLDIFDRYPTDIAFLLRELKELREAVSGLNYEVGHFDFCDLDRICEIIIEQHGFTDKQKHHAQVLLKAITAEQGE